MGSGYDRTFRVNFSGEGVAKLREHVKEKLKEFMGDYTDDTLVEYVIVLLKNGRHKEEARNELDVFLGDDSDSFVSWLWDHLVSNLNLYVQQRENPLDDVITTRPASDEKAGKNDTCQLGSESNKVESDKSRPRHRREWKGLVRDTDQHPPLRSVVVDISHREEVKHKKPDHIKRSISSQREVQRKRSRHEYQKMKREVISQATIAAPRRLLQFAVRDAVATSRLSHLATESSLKRIRSVVSTSLEDSSIEKCLHRKQSVAKGPNAIVTAIKAVAEAAKDVTKVTPSANVFDRLGHATNTLDTSALVEESREDIAEDMEDETFVDVMEVPPTYQQRNYTGQYARKLQGNTGMALDPGSDDGGYNDINVVGQEDLGAKGTFVGKTGVSPLMVDYSVVNSADGIMPKALKNQYQPTSIPNASRKMMTGSLNVNTWKSPQYQEARKALRVEACEYTENSGAVDAKPGKPFLKKNSDPVTVENRSVKPSADTEKESQKIQSVVPGLYSTGPAPEDTDSRTIFVNNVHFAATKDSLSLHFNKFGEVLKVVFLTDAATGQPKGSAYVEFMRKESAERALSLDGTSFMSRILKVVKKGSAPPEATSVMTRPRVVRGGPFTASRFARVPFPQGIPSVYRAQLPIKPGARSMQWKRDAKLTSAENVGTAVASNNAMSSMTARSMTYVRAEQKTN